MTADAGSSDHPAAKLPMSLLARPAGGAWRAAFGPGSAAAVIVAVC
jgi:hypothetical protein